MSAEQATSAQTRPRVLEVFVRRSLTAARPPAGCAALLEGDWPAEAGGRRWSVEAAIDARHATLDTEAQQLVERLGQLPEAEFADAPPLACVDALRLRYYMVKLLRVIAFLDQWVTAPQDTVVRLHACAERHTDYVLLLSAWCAARGAALECVWHDEPAAAPAADSAPNAAWRRWLEQAAGLCDRLLPATRRRGAGTRVLLCGNPRVLWPLVEPFQRRNCPVAWLVDRFAVRLWWRGRRKGIEQLVCRGQRMPQPHLRPLRAAWPALVVRGVDLREPLEHFLDQTARRAGRRWRGWQATMRRHFDRWQPDLLVVDQDATPFARLAVFCARQHGAHTAVVQHGAPVVRFGFAPLLADRFCAWNQATARQLAAWGVAREKILVTGRPTEGLARRARRRRPPFDPAAPRVLILATVPPRDERPDAVAFHLTQRTHAGMWSALAEALRQLPAARVSVRLHPRGQSARVMAAELRTALERPVRILRGGELLQCFEAHDVVLSLASSAGTEAAALGWPVVQVLPQGSGDLLPAAEWGLVCMARTAEEIYGGLCTALNLAAQRQHRQARMPAANHTSAAAVVETLLDDLRRLRDLEPAMPAVSAVRNEELLIR